MSTGQTLLLFLGALLAGAINSVAGGGTIISYPAALAAGLSPITANATNTVALVPGSLAAAWGYRRELAHNFGWVRRFLLPSLVGGVVGAWLVVVAPERVFEAIIPWLVLFATLLILFQEPIRRARGSGGGGSAPRSFWPWLAILGMAIYGGYFGAGIGIITLAVLGAVTPMDLHSQNATKTILASVVNGAATITFLLSGAAHLTAAGIMTIGSILGGYLGARAARKLPATRVRPVVVGIGLCLTAVLAARWLRGA